MVRFRRRRGDEREDTRSRAAASAASAPQEAAPEPSTGVAAGAARGGERGGERGGMFARLRAGLRKSRSTMAEGLGNLLLGEKQIDEGVLEELETRLLMADVGVEATRQIVDHLTARVKRRELNDAPALMEALRDELVELLQAHRRPFAVSAEARPYVVLVVGVNGVGKTTTIGKLAHRLSGEGHAGVRAAGDTFRAAAVEQLQEWGERARVPVIAQQHGADAASVVFDALESARARDADVVIADTAGRLHNKANLMEELAKVRRVMGRFAPEAPHEVLLVLDAGTGQNALAQAQEFMRLVDVTGIALTKLDGTAKGGIVFAVARATGLPIQFIGVGERPEDLRPFDPHEFVAALLEPDASTSDAGDA